MLNDPPVWFYRWSSVVWNDYSPLYQRNNWIHVKCDRIVWGWKNRVYTNDEGQHVCQFRISFKPRMISCMFMSSPESSVRMMCMIDHQWSFHMCKFVCCTTNISACSASDILFFSRPYLHPPKWKCLQNEEKEKEKKRRRKKNNDVFLFKSTVIYYCDTLIHVERLILCGFPTRPLETWKVCNFIFFENRLEISYTI